MNISLQWKELAAKGNIEAEVLIKYVINGIEDDSNCKMILYGAKNLIEFKEKPRTYNDTRKKTDQRRLERSFHKGNRTKDAGSIEAANAQQKRTAILKKTDTSNKLAAMRCFNCGDSGYKFKDCRSKLLSTKRFECKQFGHLATNCNEGQSDKSIVTSSITDVNNIATSVGNRMYKKL